MNSALIKRLRKIATLESEDYGAEPQDHSSWQAADLIERQAAQIEQMREAMLCTDPEMTHHNFIAALEATPDQALEQFAGRVREQCAEVCEEHQGSAETCADAIRAIKELP